MALVAERPLNENANGGQVYLPTKITLESRFPLGIGDDVYLQVVPHQAVVILPEEPEYPLDLTLRDPELNP